MAKYFQVQISAETTKEADKILNSLLKLNLVSGGLISYSPARFWWKKEIVDMDYHTISAFTTEKCKEKIIADVRKTSVEEVPMVWFVEFEGNEELLRWLDENLI